MNIWLALLLVWGLAALASYNAWQLWRWSPRPAQCLPRRAADEVPSHATRAA